MLRLSCCPFLKSNCVHHTWLCDDCVSGKLTPDDQLLNNQVKAAYRRQSPLLRIFLHLPILWPCCLVSACASCLCESGDLANYDVAKLGEGHRFEECVCFNMVMNYTMTLDPNFKHPQLHQHHQPQLAFQPVINIVNNNNNEVRSGDVNLSNVGNASNVASTNSGSGSAGVQTPPVLPGVAAGAGGLSLADIKRLKVEKAVREERYSDAEKIMNA